MAQRKQVDDLDYRSMRGVAEDLDPAARPVDTYYRPADKGVEKPGVQAQWAKNLSEGLAELAQPMQSLTGAVAHSNLQEQQEQLKKGEIERMENAEKWAQAVRDGQIPEGANPWLIKGVYRQEGRAKAAEYNAQLSDAMAKSGINESDNPLDVAKFIEKFRGDYLKENEYLARNMDASDTFVPNMRAAEANLQQHHMSERQKEFSRRVRDNGYSEVVNLTRDLKATVTHPDLIGVVDPLVERRKIGTEISARMRGLYDMGLRGKEVGELTVDGVVAAAVEAQDVSLLDTLDDVTTKEGHKLGNTKYAREQRIQAANQIRRELEHDVTFKEGRERYRVWKEVDLPHAEVMRKAQEEELQRKRDKRIESDKAEVLMSDMYTWSFQNPAKDITAQPKWRELAKLEPKQAEWVRDAQRQYRENGSVVHDDSTAVNSIMARIGNNPTNVSDQEIFNGVPARTWGVPTTRMLFEFKRKMQNAEEQDPIYMKDQSYLSYKTGIMRAIAGSELNFDTSKSQVATLKQVEFIQYAMSIKGGSLPEYRDKLKAKFEEITKPYSDAGAEERKVRGTKDAAPATPAPAQSKTQPQPAPPPQKVNQLTPELAQKFPGKRATDEDTGRRFQSDGVNWIPIQ
jgi:hypothetical protein